MKRHDKLSKDEIRERRRQKALDRGERDSGEYDDEINSDSDYGTLERDTNGEPTSKRRRRQRQNQVAISTETEGNGHHPPCPDGFDPAKWAKMSLEEKCKHLGIDIKEWLKMNREQQMQRMHNLAKNFHFYSLDKVADDAQKYTGRKKWHL